MKLSAINEVQLKTTDTNMNRSNAPGALGVNSVNNLYKPPRKSKAKKPNESNK